MATYIRSWLSPQLSVLPSYETPIPPQIHEINSSEDDNDDPDSDGTIKGDKEEDDVPPSFPALNSAQRMSSRSSVPRILTDSELMPPPPPPKLASRRPGVQPASSSLSVPASASSLAVPTTTTKPPAKKASRKVALAPGHGPLDWANLKKSGADLRVSVVSSSKSSFLIVLRV